MLNAPSTGSNTGSNTAAGNTAPATAPPPTTVETLPTVVPTLELNGSNWPVFSMRFRQAMHPSKWWGYFSGTLTLPVPVDPSNIMADETEAQQKWVDANLTTQYLLVQWLSDSIAFTMMEYPTAHEQWKSLSDHYTKKSAYVKNNLEPAFCEMKCLKNSDVRTFLVNIWFKCQELKVAGIAVTDSEYQQTVLRGIPEDLACFASSLLSSARLLSSSTPIDIDSLIDAICEEADRLKARKGQSQANNTNQKSGGKDQPAADDALAATGSEGKKKRRKGKCHNCGKLGH